MRGNSGWFGEGGSSGGSIIGSGTPPFIPMFTAVDEISDSPFLVGANDAFIPVNSEVQDLGSVDNRFKDLYLGSVIDYTSDLTIQQDGTSRVYIEDGGNVAIGENFTNPLGLLHVQNGIAGIIVPSAEADDLIIEGEVGVGISLFTQDNEDSKIFYGNVSNPTAMKLSYFGASDTWMAELDSASWGAFQINDDGVHIGLAPGASLFNVIANNSAGVPAQSASTIATFLNTALNTTNTNVSVISGNSGISSISFGDNNLENPGLFQYNNSLNTFNWYTNSTLRMTMDGNGKMAINTTPNAAIQLRINGSTTGYGISAFNDHASLGAIVAQQSNTATLAHAYEALGTAIGYYGAGNLRVGTYISLTGAAGNRVGVHSQSSVQDSVAVLGQIIGGNFASDITFGIRGRVVSNGSGDVSDCVSGSFDFLDTNLAMNHTRSVVRIEKNITNLNGFDHSGTLLHIESNNDSTGHLMHVVKSGGKDACVMTSIGLVGINTQTPTALLHVIIGGTPFVAPSADTVAIFQNSTALNTDVMVSIISGTGGDSVLAMGDSADEDAGNITYANGNNSMRFFTNGSEHVRITSTGQFAIGTTAPNASALLDIVSTTQGILFPRMTAAQGSAITGVDGLVIYVTSTNATFLTVGFYGHQAGAWAKL